MLEQAPDLDTLVVPVGGGGLIAGTALAAKALRPTLTVVGVQADRFGAAAALFNGTEPEPVAAGYGGRGDRRGETGPAHHADHPRHG